MAESILVAGGAGYIGAHVAHALSQAGLTPVVLDNFSAGHRAFVKFGPLVEGCVSDEALVRETVKAHNIRAVIDLAGCIEVAESVQNPLKYYENNVARKVPFLRALLAAGVECFVFSSTAAVYGEPTQVPIPESHATSPTNPYGWSKLMFERLLTSTAAASNLRFTALRYFNAAGALEGGEIGEAHDPESHLIPRACLASLGRIEPLHIFGNDYPTPDGTAVRDYIHVCDLAEAHVLAVKALLNGAPSSAYNLGNGIGTSILEVLKAFEPLGVKVPHTFQGRRTGDPSRLVADSTAAKKALGWAPKHAAIETIVRTAYQWHANRE